MTQTSLENIEFNTQDIHNIVKALDPHKSCGPDNIHIKLIKEGINSLALPLYLLFRKSLDTGEIPVDWKLANVTPIHKTGNKNNANNYRPVSLT